MGELVLGFDLGVINCSYCIMNDKYEIIDWNLIDVVENDKQTYEKICHNLMISLDKLNLINKEKYPGYDSMDIITELQHKINNKTIVMTGHFQMYYVRVKNNNVPDNYNINKVITYHAKNKLLFYVPMEGDPPIKTDYASVHYRNKKVGMQICEIMLKRNNEEKFLEFYNNQKKKDDLADSYLMTYAYMLAKNNNELDKESKKTTKKKTTKKKPAKKKTTKKKSKEPEEKEPEEKEPEKEKKKRAPQKKKPIVLDTEEISKEEISKEEISPVPVKEKKKRAPRKKYAKKKIIESNIIEENKEIVNLLTS